jgi:hypothetical protein
MFFLQKLVKLPAGTVKGPHFRIAIKIPTTRPAIGPDQFSEFFGGRDVVFVINADTPDDFSPEEPEIRQMSPDSVFCKTAFYQKLGERSYFLQQLPAVMQILFDAHPALRPFWKVGTDVSQFAHR